MHDPYDRDRPGHNYSTFDTVLAIAGMIGSVAALIAGAFSSNPDLSGLSLFLLGTLIVLVGLAVS